MCLGYNLNSLYKQFKLCMDFIHTLSLFPYMVTFEEKFMIWNTLIKYNNLMLPQ